MYTIFFINYQMTKKLIQTTFIFIHHLFEKHIHKWNTKRFIH